MPSLKQQLGKESENLARQYLEKLGYVFVEAQWHSRFGEVDLIMEDKDELVFVEVKMRSSHRYGYPEEMVSFDKAQRIIKTAELYLSSYDDPPFYRYDIIAVLKSGTRYDIKHFEDVFQDVSLS